METSLFIFVLVAFFVVVIGGAIWQTVIARTRYETVVNLDPERTIEVVHASFNNLLWADVSGPGDINKRRRTLKDTGATISVTITPQEDGTTLVETWMSEWSSRYGLVASPGWQNGKRVAKKLERA